MDTRGCWCWFFHLHWPCAYVLWLTQCSGVGWGLDQRLWIRIGVQALLGLLVRSFVEGPLIWVHSVFFSWSDWVMNSMEEEILFSALDLVDFLSGQAPEKKSRI